MTAQVSNFVAMGEYLGALSSISKPHARLHALGGIRDARTFTDEERAFVESITEGRRFKPKECYLNAQTLAMEHPDTLKYVEGYIWRRDLPIPIEHAWVEFEGSVVELTLRPSDAPKTGDVMKDLRRLARTKPLLQPEPGDVYWGYEVPAEVIAQVWLKDKVARPLGREALEMEGGN